MTPSLWQKIFKELRAPDNLTCLLRNLYADQLELDMEQTGSKSVKEYVKAVYCHLLIQPKYRVHHEKCWAV